MKKLILCCLLSFVVNQGYAQDDEYEYWGTYSTNEYDPNSTSNSYGVYGSPYSPDSINNPYGTYGSPYSPNSVNNPYATDTPELYSSDGEYLGKVSSNKYDPDSIGNPYGRYGSRYSPDSINNPHSIHGSKYSPQSPNNPFATEPPNIIFRKKTMSSGFDFDD